MKDLKNDNVPDDFYDKIDNYKYTYVDLGNNPKKTKSEIKQLLKKLKNVPDDIDILEELYLEFSYIRDDINSEKILCKMEKIIKKNKKAFSRDLLRRLYEFRCEQDSYINHKHDTMIKGRKLYPESIFIFILYLEYLFGEKKFEELLEETNKLNFRRINNDRIWELYIIARNNTLSFKGLYKTIQNRIKKAKNDKSRMKFNILLGYYFINIEAFNESKEVFRKYLDIDDSDIMCDAYWGLAQCLWDEEGKDAALKMLYKAVKEKPLIREDLIEMIKIIEDDDDDSDDDGSFEPEPEPGDGVEEPDEGVLV